MFIIRTIFTIFLCLVELILILPAMLWMKQLKKSNDPKKLAKRDRIVNALVGKWARSILFYSGVNVTVTGLEHIPEQACVLVGNHQGYFDIIALLGSMGQTRAFMGQIAFKKVPLLSGWMQNLDSVFINRTNPRDAITSIKEAEKLLLSGKDIYVFPEGTRSKSDQIAPFKQGAFRMATNTRSPIVPYLIDGTYKAFEANGGWIKPANVKITVLPPIFTQEMDRTRINQITDEVREIIVTEQQRQFALKESIHG